MIKKINEKINFRGFDVIINRGDESDANYDELINIKIVSSIGKSSAILQPLWNLNNTEEFKDYKEKFNEGDYFQQTIISNPTQIGLGGTLHDFLIENMFQYGIKNVYSTLFEEDEYGLSDEAIAFWDKRVNKEKAEYVSNLKRYKILS